MSARGKAVVGKGAAAAEPPLVPSATVHAATADWSLAEYVCTAGPDDPAFEEARQGFTVAAVLSGTFRYRTDTGEAILHPGALLLGNRDTCYACGHEHSRGDRCIALHVGAHVFEEISATAAGSARYRFAMPMLPAMPRLQAGFSALSASLQRADGIEIETRISDLLEDVLATASGAEAAPQKISAQDEKRITRVLHLLEEGFAETHDLDALASTAGMSKYHFLRAFRRVTGQPPHRYLLGLRMGHVARRLVSESTPVSTLALEAGFGDLSTFNSRFKQHFGESPTAWRRRQRSAAAR